jgi:RNA polymerase sigma-70 factor (ECF subfamily)
MRQSVEEQATIAAGDSGVASVRDDPYGIAVPCAVAVGAAQAAVTGPQTLSRIDLVGRARNGDRVAFERLVERWIEPAFRTALAILGREADARDATQDALLDAWRNMRQLRDPERFDAWLGRIHLNACRTAGRRRGRATIHEISVSFIPEMDEPFGRRPGVADESAGLDELERAFERLSLPLRTVLVLHHWQRRSVDEIAAVLAIPEGTVKWRLHEARAALACALEEERR